MLLQAHLDIKQKKVFRDQDGLSSVRPPSASDRMRATTGLASPSTSNGFAPSATS